MKEHCFNLAAPGLVRLGQLRDIVKELTLRPHNVDLRPIRALMDNVDWDMTKASDQFTLEQAREIGALTREIRGNLPETPGGLWRYEESKGVEADEEYYAIGTKMNDLFMTYGLELMSSVARCECSPGGSQKAVAEDYGQEHLASGEYRQNGHRNGGNGHE